MKLTSKLKTFFSKYRTWFIGVLVIALAIAGYAYYKSQSNKLLDVASYNEFKDSINELEDSEAGGFTSQVEL